MSYTKEFHLYLYEPLDTTDIFLSYNETELAIQKRLNIIRTLHPHFLSTELLRNEYKVFIHFENNNSTREIRYAHNLEKLLFNGEFDK